MADRVEHSFLDAPPWRGRLLRRMMRAMPSPPRCKICYAPFTGVGSRFVRLAGFAPSRKNPEFCKWCFEEAPLGGVEREVGIMFADIRGFTTKSEGLPPSEAAAIANRFYGSAAEVLIRHVAIIDKMEGDAVLALFLPMFISGDYRAEMVRAAEDLLAAVDADTDAAGHPLGIGLAAGVAFVGNVGAGEVKDFTAIGDVVNTASRIQGEAQAGQIVMTEAVYEAVASRYPEVPGMTLEVKGKSEPVRVRVIDRGGAVPAES